MAALSLKKRRRHCRNKLNPFVSATRLTERCTHAAVEWRLVCVPPPAAKAKQASAPSERELEAGCLQADDVEVKH